MRTYMGHIDILFFVIIYEQFFLMDINIFNRKL